MVHKKPTPSLTDQDLVQRKLSGIFCQVTVDIPWTEFESFAVQMSEHLLDDGGLDLDIATIIEREGFKEHFEEYVQSYYVDQINNLGDGFYDEACDASRIFRADIKAHREKLRKESEALKAAMEAAAEARRKEEANGVLMRIPKKNAKKAEQILRAAGVIK